MTVAIAITTRTTTPYTQTITTLSGGADTLAYTPGTNQVLHINNTSSGSITVTLIGAGASATYAVPGAGGTTINAAAGKVVTVAIGATVAIPLDQLPAYLVGAVTVTSSSATLVLAACLQG